MMQIISHDLNEVWDDISEFLDQENFRISEFSGMAFSPLETPTFGTFTRTPRIYDEFVQEPPISLAMPPPPPPIIPNATFTNSLVYCRQSSPTITTCRQTSFPNPYNVSTCSLSNNRCSSLPTTSTVSNTTYYATLPIKEESPPSSPEIAYSQFTEATYSRSPLANSLPDLNMPNQRNRKASSVMYYHKSRIITYHDGLEFG
ncbi:hypothetical protein DICVIV_05032 [Dictyocaulus viviparus]|uniref:Uncharacterized protein n=1 Tax=Dictyocaulus viviparus TaxID=29172 RepID=A0A0D8XYD3_DICVI|nr:hypothetical protein DICVIV_05032 [Dictyocaulus viviparus]